MKCSLYDYDLQDFKFTRDEAQKDKDAKERMKEVQAEYYKRRGFFHAYKRKVAKKSNISSKELSHIKTIEELDKYCSDKIKEIEGVEITSKATAYYLRLC